MHIPIPNRLIFHFVFFITRIVMAIMIKKIKTIITSASVEVFPSPSCPSTWIGQIINSAENVIFIRSSTT